MGHPKPARHRPAMVGLMLCLLMGSWIILATLLNHHYAQAHPPPQPSLAALTNLSDFGRAFEGQPGPWGHLQYVRINIELPDRFYSEQVTNTTQVRWVFKGYSREQVEALFRKIRPTRAQYDALLHRSSWETDALGVTVLPPPEVVWELEPDPRRLLYTTLAAFEENDDQFTAFRFRPELLDDRFAQSGLSPESIAAFKRLLYPQGRLLLFADWDAMVEHLPSTREKLQFAKVISRKTTFLIKLRLQPDTDVESLLAYWGIGGRAKDMRPLLESLVRVPEGCTIDIAHLLPPFARRRIYTYPTPEQEQSESVQCCHWTSFNFFNATPNDQYGTNPDYVSQKLETDYTVVPSQPRFGDVLMFKNAQGIAIHSAVYIADDIVYTKNGFGNTQPWIYMKIDDLLPYYSLSDERLSYLIFRRKDL